MRYYGLIYVLISALILIPISWLCVDAFILHYEEPYKLGIIIDIQSADDAFNSLVLQGAYKLKKEPDITLLFNITKKSEYYNDTFNDMVKNNPDLILSSSANLEEPLMKSARENSDIKYLVVDMPYTVDEMPANVANINFRANEPSFIAGYIAGTMTKTRKIGFIGGMNTSIIDTIYYGYLAGVKTAAYKNGGRDIDVIRKDVGSFFDGAGGKRLANEIYDEGADIIFAAAGPSGFGVFPVAKERNRYVIGVDTDQEYLAPGHVLFSVTKEIPAGVYDTVMKYKNGENLSNQIISLGYKENAVDVVSFMDIIPSGVVQYADLLKSQIESGVITVPDSQESYEKWAKQEKL